MSPQPPSPPPVDPGAADAQDYLLDMIEQLAVMAHELKEAEVALHLEATAESRRMALRRRKRP